MAKDARTPGSDRRSGPPGRDDDPTLLSPVRTRPRERAIEIGETVSHYRILQRLGGGGMGDVFEAEDLRLGRKVALKFLKPWIAREERLRARLQREARAASALDHPNICTIHDIDETTDGQLFIVMAFCEGEALDKRIGRGPLPVDEAFEVAVQVARGLARAHAEGIVHRDVKPANLMITPDTRVKILDFGIAQLGGRAHLTEPGGVLGTMAYMSPEQAQGERTDARTDIWSLGVVLYEMLTGWKPFRGGEGPGALGAILNDNPQPVSDLRPAVGRDLERIVERALAKRRAERYLHMSDLLRELISLKEPDAPAPAVSLLPLPSTGREAATADGAPPAFVARDGELALLDRFLEKTLSGHGLVAFVTGEAGSGKTALMTEFAQLVQAAEEDLLVAGGTCNAHTSIGDPYLPFREVLALLTSDVEARWAAGAMTREQASRLWNLLPESVEALLAAGLGLLDTFVPGAALLARAEARATGRPPWLARLAREVERSAERDAARLTQADLFEQYAKVLRKLARHRPLLLLLDDLQWADAGSISLLFHLGMRLAASRILIVGAFRPTEVAFGRDGERHPLEPVRNELQRKHGSARLDLDQASGRDFVEALLDTEPNRLGAGFRRTLYRQTRGHALYTVELLREMQDSGALVRDREERWIEGPSLDWAAMPARVEAVVEERIGRLDEDLRELMTVASVEGEDFTAEAVAASLGADEFDTVRRFSGELDRRHRLVRPRGYRQLGEQRLSRFRFRHHLFQKYLYHALAESERAYLHERIGIALETLYGDRTSEISVELARHFQQAGLAGKAASYLQAAAETAVRQSACEEAVAHLERGLELLATLPKTPERDRRELDLLTSLGPVLMAAKGWVAPETKRAYTRMRDLGQRLGERSRLFPISWGLWQIHNVAAELDRAREVADELLDLARRPEDPALLPAAYRALGETYFWLGEFEAASAHCEQGFTLYDPAKHRSHGYLYGLDSGVICLGFWSWSLWCLGYPDQALERARQAEVLAREVEHPFSLGLARYYVASCHQWRGEVAEALEWAEATADLAAREGFAMLLLMGSQAHGWALAEQGEAAAGIAEMRQGLERWVGDLARSFFASMLAEGLLGAGDAEGAQAAVAEGLAIAARSQDRMWSAELHRLHGEVLARRGAPASEVEASLRQAVELARRQGARSLELRAATSLARLSQRQRNGEARRSLAEVCGAFTEGFGTRDLQRAEEVLSGVS